MATLWKFQKPRNLQSVLIKCIFAPCSSLAKNGNLFKLNEFFRVRTNEIIIIQARKQQHQLWNRTDIAIVWHTKCYLLEWTSATDVMNVCSACYSVFSFYFSFVNAVRFSIWALSSIQKILFFFVCSLCSVLRIPYRISHKAKQSVPQWFSGFCCLVLRSSVLRFEYIRKVADT